MTRDTFIEKAIAIHGKRYDYSQVEYETNKIPVIIICAVHGEFRQRPDKHLQGQNCPLCAKNAKMDTATFIQRAKSVHGDQYDYNESKYVNAVTPVRIKCTVCGKLFKQTPHKHLRGQGCPECRYRRARQTVQEHYGVDNPMRADGVKEKLRDTMQKRYGVDNPMKLAYVQERVGSTVTARYGVKHYSQTGDWRDKVMRTNQQRYGVDFYSQSEECKEKVKSTSRVRYGTENVAQSEIYHRHINEYLTKSYETKIKNGTWNTSKPEDKLYERLIEIMGEEKVIRQYKSKKYPFACDFYIPERDMYIELNANWTHGGEWFDPQNPEHIARLEQWKSKGDQKYYQNAVNVWTKMDVKKREYARKNKLNYIVFWDNQLRDVDIWMSMGCPDGQDWEQMYSYYPVRDFKPDKPEKWETKKGMSNLVRYYQYPIFYARELKAWNENKLYRGQISLQSWLYRNRLQYLQKNPYRLRDVEILRGFKIAGIVDGYTIFDPDLMKQAIERYDIHSIYDPCAGWGERLLTCHLLGVRYHGYDINSGLEDGYRRMISDLDMKEQSFRVCDSTKIRQKKQCDAVLTCPPYFNRERYSTDGAENFSYDDFLKWWELTVKRSLQVDPKYFCFQINQKYKEAMSDIVASCGFKLIDELHDTIRASHFHRRDGGNQKKEHESMLIFERQI